MINRRTLLQSILAIPFLNLETIKIIGYGWCQTYKKINFRDLPKSVNRISFPGRFNLENRKRINLLFENPDSSLMKELEWKNKIDIKEYEVKISKDNYQHVFQLEKSNKIFDGIWYGYSLDKNLTYKY